MTEREKFNIHENKIRILNRDFYTCQYPGCNNKAIYLAHKICSSKDNLKKYGKEIIHNDKNLVSVCEIQSHNDWFNISFNEGKVKDILNEINS
jgi:hypothetical protein